jgi:hypothetical protein
MPLRRSASFLLAALAAAAPAAAGTLASGVVDALGGTTSDIRVRCLVTNVGTKPVTVSEARIVDTNGDLLVLVAEDCTDAPVAPNETCVLLSDLGFYAGAGVLDVKGSTKNLRGRCQVITGDQVVHSESEMR